MTSKDLTDAPEWHYLDATDKVLGRLATEAAQLLMGKHRADWAAHRVAPVYVVITNTDRVAVTGRKEEQKLYRHYTGHPGGLKEKTLAEVRRRDSRKILEGAIAGMLPKNNLRDDLLRHLKLYPGVDHPHQNHATTDEAKTKQEN